MYDFALQQKLFEHRLEKKGLSLAIEGGTLSGDFGHVQLNAQRDALRSVMGLQRDEPCTLCSTMYPGNQDKRHTDGFAVGIRLTFGR